MSIPTIALSAHWHTYPDRFEWITEHGFAAEYSPNPQAFDRLPAHIGPFLETGVPVRYHGFFPRHEFGHADAVTAERAVQVHLSALEAMQGRGEQIITLHIGLNPEVPLDLVRAVTNLSRLVERGGVSWASPSAWRTCAGGPPAILRQSSSGRVNPGQ